MSTRVRSFIFGVLAAAPALALAGPAAAGGDAERGQQVFQQCAACHSEQPGQTLMGPSLAGIVGREVGSVSGFNFSGAMAEASFDWTPERLDSYLAAPDSELPGNQMPFAGIDDSQDRADLIAYLETLSQ